MTGQHLLYLPEELSFPEDEDDDFMAQLIEYMSMPLEPQCPECAEERKVYGCIFPPVPCLHGEEA